MQRPFNRQFRYRHHDHGGATTNLIVALICIVIILVMFAVINSRRNHRSSSSGLTARDSTYVRGIHQSWLIFARDFEGQYPTPGLIDRLPFNGVEEPGRGLEDITKNTTASLYSVCVMLNYISPEICVGPTETNPNIQVFDMYNYPVYSPATGVYWDPNFKANLHAGSHVSYAHLPLIPRWKKNWGEGTLSSTLAILGNRRPRDGIEDPKSHAIGLHPPFDKWSGNICFADNHTEFHVGLKPVTRRGATIDLAGIFRMDAVADGDGVLTFTKTMSETGPEIQHD